VPSRQPPTPPCPQHTSTARPNNAAHLTRDYPYELSRPGSCAKDRTAFCAGSIRSRACAPRSSICSSTLGCGASPGLQRARRRAGRRDHRPAQTHRLAGGLAGDRAPRTPHQATPISLSDDDGHRFLATLTDLTGEPVDLECLPPCARERRGSVSAGVCQVAWSVRGDCLPRFATLARCLLYDASMALERSWGVPSRRPCRATDPLWVPPGGRASSVEDL
jgi:hypothetical protein